MNTPSTSKVVLKSARARGKDLIFADPMNATGSSLAAVLWYLQGQGIRPRSVACFNVIAALKGALRTIRAFGGCAVYALWMDPMLNKKAYIMPGLGDAGDRKIERTVLGARR